LSDASLQNTSNDSVLVRAVGFWALTAAVVNITIGGSIFALPGTLAASMGAAAPLAFVLGALLFVPIVLCFASAGSRVTVTGGPYSYVAAAFGAFPGFMIAAFFWTSSVAGSATLAAILADQVALVFAQASQPLSRSLFMFFIYGILIAINARGIKLGATLIVVFAAAKLVPLMLLAVVGSRYVQLDNLRITAAPSWASVGSSLVIVVFAYSGIETALAPSGEMKDPVKAIPRAAFAGVAVVVALYVGLQWIAQGALGVRLIGNSAPLAAVADLIAPGGGHVLVLVASVSLLGCMQGDLLGSSRLLYALARDGFLPKPFALVTKTRRVPLLAVAGHSCVAWILASLGSFTMLARISGGAFCFVYIASCAAAWQLQRLNVGGAEDPLRLRGGSAIPLVAIVGLCCILATLRRPEWIAIGCTVLAVAILYAGAHLLKHRWA
jgi:basic amino acid/polyamine antiporter, APA family